jgi:hypothetical protein
MKNKEFIEGIAIIGKYAPEKNDWNLCAEHDQIWFGAYEWVTDEKDISRLEELGWFEDMDSWSCST